MTHILKKIDQLGRLWSGFSLDAPSVAVVLCLFWMRTIELVLPLPYIMILALSTWLIYLADRLLDSRTFDMSQQGSERHRYHAHYAKYLGLILGIGLILDLIWVHLVLPRPILIRGYGLCGFTLLYLLLVHYKSPLKFSKEILVATIFVFGIGIFSPQTFLSPWLLIGGFLLWLQILLNLLLISFWEWEWDQAHGFHRAKKELSQRHLSLYWFGLAICWLAYMGGLYVQKEPFLWIWTAFIPVHLFYGYLLWKPEDLSTEQRRWLVDFALLIPALWLLF